MSRYLAALVLSTTIVAFTPPSYAQSTPPSAAAALPSSAAADQTDPAGAKALLMRMADFLSKAQSFSVTMNVGFDVVQGSGQKIEFGETRHVLINRPNDLRIDVEASNGLKQQLTFDGKAFTLYTPAENAFANMNKPGSVDDILRYIIGDLQTPIPLSLLLAQSMPQVLEARVTEVEVVEPTTIAGIPATHLAARTADIDFQVWVADGDQPVPLRAIITYKQAEGDPQFWANLTDWNFAPKIDPASFTFVKPAGAQSVAFLVPIEERSKRSGVGK